MGKLKNFVFRRNFFSTKPVLPAEAMWNWEQNSEDELNLVYKEQFPYLPEPTNNPLVEATVPENAITTDWKYSQKPEKEKKTTTDTLVLSEKPISLDSSDEEFDQRLKIFSYNRCASTFKKHTTRYGKGNTIVSGGKSKN